MSTALSAPRPAPSPPLPWIWWGTLAAAVVGLAALFGSSLLGLQRLWDLDQNYSHGYLVAPISLALAYRSYRKVGAPVRGELLLGLSGVIFGILCQLASNIVRWPPLSYLGLLAVLRGLLVCAGGRQWASAFTFPLLFLFFMFPLPITWTGYAALWLQDVVARISETVLSLFVVCTRVGNTIRIAGLDRPLVVAEECSGLGQIVAFLAFGALLGELFSRPVWYRIVLLIAAVPLAIAANTLRVVLMNLGAYWFGTGWMAGQLHDVPALFSIPVGIIFFLIFDRVLAGLVARPDNVQPTQKSNAEIQPTPAANENACPLTQPSVPSSASGVGRRLLIATVVLGLGVAAQFSLNTHLQAAGELSYPHLIARFESLHKDENGRIVILDPETKQPQWLGAEMTADRDNLRTKLHFQVEDLLIRAYMHRDYLVQAQTNQDGTKAVQLYMVYSLAGEDRKHHPEICVRDVKGAPEDVQFRRRVPLAADGSAEAMRFRFFTGAVHSQVVYYWHYTPRPNPNPNQTSLQAIHQRFGVSAPSVTVQVTIPLYDPQLVEQVERQLLPAIHQEAVQKLLPPGTETGCARIPIGLARD